MKTFLLTENIDQVSTICCIQYFLTRPKPMAPKSISYIVSTTTSSVLLQNGLSIVIEVDRIASAE